MKNLPFLAPLLATLALSFSALGAGLAASRPETSPLPASAPRLVPGTRAAFVAGDERALLRAAEARASGLAELRGGEIVLSDSDVQLILITAAVVILLVVIF
jgi:hypothetical protein